MNKNTQYLLAGALGLVVMVVGFNSIKDSFNESMYGTVVKPVMEKYFLSPAPVTKHGREVDAAHLTAHGPLDLVTGTDAQPRCDGLDAVLVKLLLLTIADDFVPQHH